MKNIGSIAALLLACILFAACGGQKDSGESKWRGIQAGMEDLSVVTDRIEYYDIVSESEAIFQWERETERSPLSIQKAAFLSMQFYQGEPVQLWMVPNTDQNGMVQSWKVCLYRLDGSVEVVLQGVESSSKCHGYLDQDGNFYWWVNSSVLTYSDGKIVTTDTSLKKYLASGEVLFDKQLDFRHDITGICQMADGRMYLTIHDNEASGAESSRLAEIDPVTGLITEFDSVQLLYAPLGSQYLGIWGISWR